MSLSISIFELCLRVESELFFELNTFKSMVERVHQECRREREGKSETAESTSRCAITSCVPLYIVIKAFIDIVARPKITKQTKCTRRCNGNRMKYSMKVFVICDLFLRKIENRMEIDMGRGLCTLNWLSTYFRHDFLCDIELSALWYR